MPWLGFDAYSILGDYMREKDAKARGVPYESPVRKAVEEFCGRPEQVARFNRSFYPNGCAGEPPACDGGPSDGSCR
jgi:hypothetical protein